MLKDTGAFTVSCNSCHGEEHAKQIWKANREKLLLHLGVDYIILASVFRTVSGERLLFPFSFLIHYRLLCGPTEH